MQRKFVQNHNHQPSIYSSMSFLPDSGPVAAKNLDSSNQVMCFQCVVVQVWWTIVNFSLSFLFLANSISANPWKAQHVNSETLFCTACNKWLYKLLRRFYHSKPASPFWPLTSTRYFHLHRTTQRPTFIPQVKLLNLSSSLWCSVCIQVSWLHLIKNPCGYLIYELC